MVVLKKAKVMSYEDFNKARAKRAIINKINKGKGKYNDKHNAFVLDADISELNIKTVQMRETKPSGPLIIQTNIWLE